MNEDAKSSDHLQVIKKEASSLKKPITLMEICGGHTNTIMRYGIRDILPSSIRLISGPGCPVCVSDQKDIDAMIELAHNGIPVATYGDMLRVPGSKYSLEDAKARFGNVFEVYAATDVLKLKEQHPNIVFFGIGFETTTPMTAFLLEKGVTVYSVHKLVPPAMKVLLEGEVKVDGFIDPGHVSVIIGKNAYKDIHAPQVIAGFEAEHILRALRFLVPLVENNQNVVVNAYPELVSDEGNVKAQKLIEKHFKVVDSDWRGLGTLPNSGLDVREDSLNAKVVHKDILQKLDAPKKTGCKCGSILQGLMEPVECPLYRKVCTPQNPIGPCMVSDEGSCSISFRYGK